MIETREAGPIGSAGFAAAIAARDFSRSRATLIGYGNMGRQYFAALRRLGVQHIRVCSRDDGPLAGLQGMAGVEIVRGGIENFRGRPAGGELAIVATPMDILEGASTRLADLGFRDLLIEKPVALSAPAIADLAERFASQGVRAAAAYNRMVYPSLLEVQARAAAEGGITSCTYALTEMIKPDWPARFNADELARWGVANTLHVISMAHALIGWPAEWTAHRAGAIDWHPTGAVFVGSGLSDRGIPFAYHGDWGSQARWVVEVHTAAASYRMMPLETVQRRVTPTGDWEPVPLTAFAPEVKAGIVEEVAAMLPPAAEFAALLPSLAQTAELTAFAEEVFGYRE